MSLQTGVQSQRAPASEKFADRVRFRWSRWRDEPNPLWMREMRQSARLTRTPVLMMVVTIFVVLIMATIGGGLAGNTNSAEAGQILFHTYFSLAYAVVALVGPALAANSIASEREGKTWEAVLLTGLSPAVVARGKFLAALTAIGQYVIMLAPAGAIPFLFGGVGPFEVVTAFIILFAIAALSCTFGLAISAKMKSLRSALLVTLLTAVPLGSFAYFTIGVGGSALIHEIWPAVPTGAPIWLPVALSRAPFGIEYVVYLIVTPLAALGLPTWLLYELTRANLTGASDDRTLGIKHWYIVSTAVLTLLCLVPALAIDKAKPAAAALVAGVIFLSLHITFCVFLFAGEPIGPSRRVRGLLEHATSWRRALAPGVGPAANLQMLMTIAAFTVIGALGISWLNHFAPTTTAVPGLRVHVAVTFDELAVVGLMLGYAFGFAVFLIGLGARLRSRATTSGGPRILLMVLLVALFAGPWIIAAIGGITTSGTSKNALIGACLSPVYVFVAMDSLGDSDGIWRVSAAMVAAAFYGLLGSAMYLSARRRCRLAISQHEAMLQEADRRLNEEDALAAASTDASAATSSEAITTEADHLTPDP